MSRMSRMSQGSGVGIFVQKYKNHVTGTRNTRMSHLSLLCPIMSHIWTILLKLNINEIFGIGLSFAVADIVCEQLLMLVELILAMMMIIFIGAFYTRVGWWPTSAVDGRSELYVDAPSWLVLDRHQPKEYLIQRVTIFWGGWMKYFHQIWIQSCDRFCHASQSWTNAPSFHFSTSDWWNVLKSGSNQSNSFQSLLKIQALLFFMILFI